MKNFLKTALAVMVGVFFYSILMFFLVFVFFSILLSSVDNKNAVEIKANTLLKITFDTPIKDRASSNPFDNFNFQTFENTEILGLNDIVKNIKKAKVDKNIVGIYLDLSTIDAGIAQVEEIRNALLDFKTSKKFIYCNADYYSQLSYYIASVADYLYLTPTGNLDFVGFSLQIMYYKNALEKFGVEPQIVRHGKFKSAVEPFMLNEMSDANREQLETYLFSIWDDYVSKISESRKISVDSLNLFADSLMIATSTNALEHKLVDGIKYKDEVLTELTKLLGVEKAEDINVVTISDYDKVEDVKIDENFKLAHDQIAVIYALGEIGMGEGETYEIGAEGLSKTIREAREDENIKAIVLKINSPGGSALASEIIWREVMLTKAVKPVVVSMGVYAASGGYYIACCADKIVACPNTLTGSIGVFGMFFNAKDLMNNKIGISVSTVNTNKHSDIGAFYRSMLPEEQKYIQYSIEDVYSTFIKHVAEGRNMTTAEVDSIGQGRIWSGINAIKIGLVDTLGTLEDAIIIASKLADIKDYRVIDLPEETDAIQSVIKQISGDISTKIVSKIMGENYEYYNKINEIKKYQGVQARMLFTFDLF